MDKFNATIIGILNSVIYDMTPKDSLGELDGTHKKMRSSYMYVSMYIDDNVSLHTLNVHDDRKFQPIPQTQICAYWIWKSSQIEWCSQKAEIAPYLQHMLKLGAHFTVTRTVDSCFFFLFFFFFSRAA